MTEKDDVLLNSKEVARLLDLSPDTVNEFARKSIFRRSRRVRQWRFAGAMSPRSSVSCMAPRPPSCRATSAVDFFIADGCVFLLRVCARNRRSGGSDGASGSRAAREQDLLRVLPSLRPDLHSIFLPRILSTIRSLKIPSGAKVLEVGVGTGFRCRRIPAHAEVTGIDLAPEMLEQAQSKVTRKVGGTSACARWMPST